jgi:hypothetical protein
MVVVMALPAIQCCWQWLLPAVASPVYGYLHNLCNNMYHSTKGRVPVSGVRGCDAAGFHEFAEFVAEDVGTVDSGLNSMVLANNNELVLLPINEPTFGTKRKSQIQVRHGGLSSCSLHAE